MSKGRSVGGEGGGGRIARERNREKQRGGERGREVMAVVEEEK